MVGYVANGPVPNYLTLTEVLRRRALAIPRTLGEAL